MPPHGFMAWKRDPFPSHQTGKLLYSKLETGKTPTPQEVYSRVQALLSKKRTNSKKNKRSAK